LATKESTVNFRLTVLVK